MVYPASAMGQSSENVLVNLEEKIQTVRIARPHKKNALTLPMYEALTHAVRNADKDPEIRVTVLLGVRGCFTSGNDLRDFLSAPPYDESSPVSLFLQALACAEKPLIACVAGSAIGIGTTLLLHCDLVVAGRSAVFQLPFVRLGLCPEAGASYLLPKVVGKAKAAEWLLLGESFDADAALASGLVNVVTSDDELESRGMQMAATIAALPPESIRLTKSLLRAPDRQEVSRAMQAEVEAFVARLKSPEACEAMQAFLEKRPADFSSFT